MPMQGGASTVHRRLLDRAFHCDIVRTLTVTLSDHSLASVINLSFSHTRHRESHRRCVDEIGYKNIYDNSLTPFPP